jgi:hypothetical protein
MGSTKKKSTHAVVTDKPATDAEIMASSFERVSADFARTQAIIDAKYAERVARGDVPIPHERPFEFKSALEEFVREAARRGDVYYDATSGYACVQKAELPKIPAIGEAGWGTAEWDEEHHRQWQIRTYEENLSYTLGDARLHALALLCLDAPAMEVGVHATWELHDGVLDLGLVKHGIRGATPPVYERVRSHLLATKVPAPAFSGKTDGRRAHAWEARLVIAIQMTATKWRELPDPRDRVRYVLKMLEAGAAGAMPDAVAQKFREPKKDAIDDAATLMQDLCLESIKPEFWPPSARRERGRPMTEWGAAKEFARHFNVPFVEKRSRLDRRKK